MLTAIAGTLMGYEGTCLDGKNVICWLLLLLLLCGGAESDLPLRQNRQAC